MKTFLFIFNIVLFSLYAQDSSFKELKSEHFIIRYDETIQEREIDRIKEISERLYREITQEFNFLRDNYWLWENRAKIFMTKDKNDYLSFFNCTSWSDACVDYRNKIIYTYVGQENFLSILSHELTHIIFREYLGKENLPLWLDEAIALYIEYKFSKSGFYPNFSLLKELIERDGYIKFSNLFQENFFNLKFKDDKYIQIFYIECFSIIYFLLKKYPKDNFLQLLYFLRNNYNFEDALGKSYFSIKNIEDLEKQWKRFYQE
ncbi:MAG: hypothetical protein QXZ20_01550 [Candidatus Aenigmatarchaeota archaeon]